MLSIISSSVREQKRLTTILKVERDSSVGIATRYGLGGPGIESRCGARFSTPVQTRPGAHPTFYIMGTGSFPGVKRPGRGSDHPTPSSAEVEGMQSYKSTPPLDLRSLFYGEFYLYLYLYCSHKNPTAGPHPKPEESCPQQATISILIMPLHTVTTVPHKTGNTQPARRISHQAELNVQPGVTDNTGAETADICEVTAYCASYPLSPLHFSRELFNTNWLICYQLTTNVTRWGTFYQPYIRHTFHSLQPLNLTPSHTSHLPAQRYVCILINSYPQPFKTSLFNANIYDLIPTAGTNVFSI